MPVNFAYQPTSKPREDFGRGALFFDAVKAERTLACVEQAGFDSVVIDDAAGVLTNFDLATQAIVATSGLEVVLTHWAGVLEPLVAARQIAHLDQLSAGRLTLRMRACNEAGADIGGGSVSHVATLQRTDEYLAVLRRLWANEKPIDHEGPCYSVRDGFVPQRGPRGAALPIRMGGLSGSALKLAGRYADVFELPGGTTLEVGQAMDRIRIAEIESGRCGKTSFALPVRIEFLSDRNEGEPDAINIHGGPDRVALALVSYAALGISEFVVSGLTSNESIQVFGDVVAPLVRNSIARRETGSMLMANDHVDNSAGFTLSH